MTTLPQIMSPRTTSSRKLRSKESSGEQRIPEDFDYDDITIKRSSIRAEDEQIILKKKNLLSCLSSSSMSHDKTWKPVICSNYVTNKVKKFRDKTLKANKLGLFWTKKRSNPRWLSSGNSKTRTPGWLWQKKYTKIKWNYWVAAKKDFTALKLKNCNDEITNFLVKSYCSKTGSSWSSWESPNEMKELKRFRLPHSTQSQEEDGSKTRILSFNKKKSQSTKIRFTVQMENFKRQSELVFENDSKCFFLWKRRRPKAGVVLDIREGQPGPPESAFVLAPASFLTFGKVNPGLPQTDIFWGRVPPPPPPTPPPLIFVSAGRPPHTDIFFLGGGGGEKGRGVQSQPY